MTESILNLVKNATEEELFDLSDDVLQSVKELIAIGEFAQAFEITNAYIDSNEWPAYYEPMSYFEDHAKVVDFLFELGRSCSSDLVQKIYEGSRGTYWSQYVFALGTTINTNATADTLFACYEKANFETEEGQLLWAAILLRHDLRPGKLAAFLYVGEKAQSQLFFSGELDTDDDDMEYDESEYGSLARYLFGILSGNFPAWNRFMNNQDQLMDFQRSSENLKQLLDHINSFDLNEESIDWDEVMIDRDDAIPLLESHISPTDKPSN